jgi:hypothetical protein
VPGWRAMPAQTSAASAICGTTGLTKAVTSMTGSPAALNRSTNAILSAVDTEAPPCSETVPWTDDDGEALGHRRRTAPSAVPDHWTARPARIASRQYQVWSHPGRAGLHLHGLEHISVSPS